MPKFEKNILGFIPKEEWLDVGYNVARPTDPIDVLFSNEQSDNLVARWNSIMSEYQTPTAASFHALDTQAQTTFRIPVDNRSIEKGLIKVKINQSERMRELLRAGVQNNELYDYVLNDGIRLADQVVTRTFVAKNEILSTGKMTIKENGLDLTIDYGVPESHLSEKLKIVLGRKNENDAVSEIQKVIDVANDAGVIINGIVTSKAVLAKLRANVAIRMAINGGTSAVRMTDLENFLADEFGITTVITNDGQYASEYTIGADGRPQVKKERYYPKDLITFFATTPSGKIGAGLWGKPPEVDLGDGYAVSTDGQNPFIYITQWSTADPAVLWTKASGLYIPVLYDPNSIYVAEIGDNPTASTDIVYISGQEDEVGLGSKKVSELITPDTKIHADGSVTGTLKYVSSFTDFDSSNNTGNFFPFHLGEQYKNKPITVTTCNGEGCSGSDNTKTKTATDCDWVVKVKQRNTTFKFEAEGKEIITLNFEEAGLPNGQAATCVAKVDGERKAIIGVPTIAGVGDDESTGGAGTEKVADPEQATETETKKAKGK